MIALLLLLLLQQSNSGAIVIVSVSIKTTLFLILVNPPKLPQNLLIVHSDQTEKARVFDLLQDLAMTLPIPHLLFMICLHLVMVLALGEGGEDTIRRLRKVTITTHQMDTATLLPFLTDHHAAGLTFTQVDGLTSLEMTAMTTLNAQFSGQVHLVFHLSTLEVLDPQVFLQLTKRPLGGGSLYRQLHHQLNHPLPPQNWKLLMVAFTLKI